MDVDVGARETSSASSARRGEVGARDKGVRAVVWGSAFKRRRMDPCMAMNGCRVS